MSTALTISGGLALSGSAARHTVATRNLGGGLSVSGGASLSVYKIPISRTVNGMLSLSGSPTLLIERPRVLAGVLSLNGVLSAKKEVHTGLSGGLSLSKIFDIARPTLVSLTRTLSISADMLTEVDRKIAAGNPLSLSGTLLVKPLAGTSGSISLSGSLGITLPNMNFSGELALSGETTRVVLKTILRELTLSASMQPGTTNGRLLLGDDTLSLSSPDMSFGYVSFSGDLGFFPAMGLSGDVALSGEAQMPGQIQSLSSFSGDLTLSVKRAVTSTGHLAFTGSTTPRFVPDLATQGKVTFMRVLTTDVTLYTAGDASPINIAGEKALAIEQGSSFLRYFRWLKSDGIPFDLSHFTLRMLIAPTRDGGSDAYITSSDGIEITKMDTEPGMFSVYIPAIKTRHLDFTRACYIITAGWRDETTRLIEGDVTLLRGIFRRVPLLNSGGLSLYNDLQRRVGKHLSGSVQVSATADSRIKLSKQGTLRLSRVLLVNGQRYISTSGILTLLGNSEKEPKSPQSGATGFAGNLSMRIYKNLGRSVYLSGETTPVEVPGA